jgi:hypothetical protein
MTEFYNQGTHSDKGEWGSKNKTGRLHNKIQKRNFGD